MEKQEIKVVECDTMSEAESEYYRLRAEGCWQITSCLKLKWSWKKMRCVATFAVKKVDHPYHFDDYISDVHDALVLGLEQMKNIYSTISAIKRRRVNGYSKNE